MKLPDNHVNKASRSSRVLEYYMKNVKEKHNESDEVIINDDVLHRINNLQTSKIIESNIASSIECCNEAVDDEGICEDKVEAPRKFVGRLRLCVEVENDTTKEIEGAIF